MKLKYTYILVTVYIIITFIVAPHFAYSQSLHSDEMRWTKGWTNFEPNNTTYPEAEQKIANTITSNTYLSNDAVYLLSGDVYVTNNATLTIQEGTIIRCDSENPANLIITKGSKLIAAGSKAYPIVFTSNKAKKSRNNGDWGGIIIAGNGKVNTVSGSSIIEGNINPQYSIYGGQDNEEETTILRYVRIEFAGNASKKGHEEGGLALFGVGNNSIIENIMVSYSGQDSFKWRGGTSIMKNLVSFKAHDDDFDIAQGFKGTFNHIISVRHPYISSPSGSYAVEIDGYDAHLGYARPDDLTDVTLSNASLITLSNKTNYQHTSAAIYAKNTALIYITSSHISGFSDVVKLDKSFSSLALVNQHFNMDNSFFNIHNKGVVSAKEIVNKADVLKYNRFTKTFKSVDELFLDPLNKATPKFSLKKSLNNYMVVQ